MFYICCTISSILIEVFDSFETEFIYNPTIFVCFNDLIGWVKIVTILIFQMILAYYNDKWRYRLIIRIDILDYNNLFLIARLYSFSFLTPVVRCYNKSRYDLAYEKACLVEILDVGLYNIIFGNYILKKLKPNPNNLWIFVLGLLIIVRTISTYTEFWLLFDEVENPTQSDIHYIVCR